MTVCAVDECPRRATQRGWCNMHYKRWLRHGDVNHERRRPVLSCAVEGCDRPHKSKGYCGLHYMRFVDHGDAGEPGRRRRPVGSGTVNADGYIVVGRKDHPLANRAGAVMEHRVVFYDAHGDTPQNCHWCGRAVRWAPMTDSSALVVDHLDENRANNELANLVASCNRCNSMRSRIALEPFEVVA